MKVINKELIFDGKLIKLYKYFVETPDGIQEREVIEHRGAVGILAFVDNENILVEYRYRPAFDKEIIEIPAGILKPGEKPEETAIRELIEETGYKPKIVEKLISFYPTPGYTNEIIHIVIAKDLEYIGKPSDVKMSPEEKYMKVEKISIYKLLELIRNGKVVDGKTIIAVLSYLMFRK